jgi:predicted PurR-regulated permease PerM
MVVSTNETPEPSKPGPTPRYFPGGEQVAFFILVIAVVGGTAYMLWPILVGPFLGLATGSLLRRVVERRSSPLKRQITASAITTVAAVLVLGPVCGVLIWTAQAVANEVVELSTRVDELDGMIEAAADRAGPLGPQLRGGPGELTRQLANALPMLAQKAGGFASAVGAFLAQFMVGLLLYCLALYYTLLEGAAWRTRFIRALPLRDTIADELLSHFRQVSVSVIVGGLGTTLVQIVAAAIGYWLFDFEAPLFWALVTGVASFVPFVGTALVFIPLSLAHGFEFGWLQGLLVFGYGVIVIGTVDNLVRPLLVRAGLDIHPLLVFLAVFGGLASFGLIGIFTGPLLMATTISALQLYEKMSASAET